MTTTDRRLSASIAVIAVSMATVAGRQPETARAALNLVIENRPVRYGQGVDGNALLFRGQPLRLRLEIYNPYDRPPRGETAPVGAEANWVSVADVALYQGGIREKRILLQDDVCANATVLPHASPGAGGAILLAHRELQAARCVVEPTTFAKLPAGRYSVDAGWNQATAATSSLSPGFMFDRREPLQFELRDVNTPTDLLDFSLHEMEFAYFEARYNESLVHARQALAIEPHSVTALITTAHAMAALGRCADAKQAVTAAVASLDGHLDVNDRTNRYGAEQRRRKASEIAALQLRCR